ncbi:hypothetical protein ACFFGV_18570 [Pontibacillus salicampi]|uniref:Uncharacterized protein n=1 Tax=Pontibacillus salicampi TaxID=1449801 RepID=A0ABV6LT74_9BACI
MSGSDILLQAVITIRKSLFASSITPCGTMKSFSFILDLSLLKETNQ